MTMLISALARPRFGAIYKFPPVSFMNPNEISSSRVHNLKYILDRQEIPADIMASRNPYNADQTRLLLMTHEDYENYTTDMADAYVRGWTADEFFSAPQAKVQQTYWDKTLDAKDKPVVEIN